MNAHQSSAKLAVEVYLRPEPLKLATDLGGWLLSIKGKIGRRILENLKSDTDSLDRYIEFAEVEELPGAFIACSFYQKDINDALTRAGIYMGAGKGMSSGALVPQNDFTLINYKKLVAGHNLPGPVLEGFYVSVSESSDDNIRANDAEKAVFRDFIQAELIKKLSNAFYLIGFSIQTMKDQKGVISHELFHAYNFLNPEFCDVISEFWQKTVSNEDKHLITKEVGLAYNVDDEKLVIDEFQAYLLQSRAEQDRMKSFVTKYQQDLMKQLSQAQIEFVKI